MLLKAQNLSKKYNKQRIFSGVDLIVDAAGIYAITGHNGSGKSTLLKILAGALVPTSGELTWSYNGKNIAPDELHDYVGMATPYQELIEEMTLRELLTFFCKFKKIPGSYTHDDLIEFLGLQASADKHIQDYSSGMKQRVKLLLAVAPEHPFVFLDEPLSHLDASGKSWYNNLLQRFGQEKIIFVASNHNREEYPNASREIGF